MDLIFRLNIEDEWCDCSVFSELVTYLRQELPFVFLEVVIVGLNQHTVILKFLNITVV